jgi:hypothetical protein
MEAMKMSKQNKFVVQEYTLCDGWINNWSDEDGQPTKFDTFAEAEAELNKFMYDMQNAVERGYLEDSPTIDEYRIVEV